MIWGYYAIVGILEEIGKKDLAARYVNILNRMKENSMVLFWNSTATGLKTTRNVIDYRKPFSKDNLGPTSCDYEVFFFQLIVNFYSIYKYLTK